MSCLHSRGQLTLNYHIVYTRQTYQQTDSGIQLSLRFWKDAASPANKFCHIRFPYACLCSSYRQSVTFWVQYLVCCVSYIPPHMTPVLYPLPEQARREQVQSKKECMPNSKVIWNLLIEYKFSIETQINCLSLCSGWLHLLPYALLALWFEGWLWECFKRVLYSNRHLSWDIPCTNHVFISGLPPPRVREHRSSASVNANILRLK